MEKGDEQEMLAFLPVIGPPLAIYTIATTVIINGVCASMGSPVLGAIATIGGLVLAF